MDEGINLEKHRWKNENLVFHKMYSHKRNIIHLLKNSKFVQQNANFKIDNLKASL